MVCGRGQTCLLMLGPNLNNDCFLLIPSLFMCYAISCQSELNVRLYISHLLTLAHASCLRSPRFIFDCFTFTVSLVIILVFMLSVMWLDATLPSVTFLFHDISYVHKITIPPSFYFCISFYKHKPSSVSLIHLL